MHILQLDGRDLTQSEAISINYESEESYIGSEGHEKQEPEKEEQVEDMKKAKKVLKKPRTEEYKVIR